MLAHKDPSKRLQDYLAALPFYIDLLKRDIIDRLVYADNSGYGLSQFREIAEASGVADRCEFISFRSDPIPDVSRYFLEINLIKEAISKSRFMAEDDIQIWKVSGRYLVVNAGDIMLRAPSQSDFYVNCRNHPYKTLDFYLVRFTKLAFEKILFSNLEEFRTRRSGEDIVRQRIDESRYPELVITPRFNKTPRIVGTRGFDGARYGGVRDSAKFAVRYWMNMLLPQIWV